MSDQGAIQRTIGWRFIAGFIAGWLTLGFLVYPPSAGWWTSKDRLVDWLSAVGSVGAAVGAVGIAMSQVVINRRERTERSHKFAALMTFRIARHVIALRVEIEQARGFLSDSRALVGLIEEGSVRQILLLSSAEQLPEPTLLLDLPNDVAAAVALLWMATGAYNELIERAAQVAEEIPAEDAARRFTSPEMLDEVQTALANAADKLKPYQEALGRFDFLDRGDGTRLGG